MIKNGGNPLAGSDAVAMPSWSTPIAAACGNVVPIAACL